MFHVTYLCKILPFFPVDRGSVQFERTRVLILFGSSVEDRGGAFSLSDPDCVMSSCLMARHFSSLPENNLTYVI